MNRKEITAFLINCSPNEFMAYADQEEKGTVVVGPDGKKFRFNPDQLAEGELKIKEKAKAERVARKPAAKTKAASKPRTTTKRQAVTKRKQKPRKDSRVNPRINGNGP